MLDENPILMVDDEPDVRDLLQINLRREGFVAITASTGREAMDFAATHKVRCILLDLMLPDISGNQLCRWFRANETTQDVPIIMVTARDEEIDRVVGFEVGADDYVVKANLSVRELVLRVRAVLRRYERRAKEIDEPAESIQEFGCLRLDTAGYRAWVEGREVSLTATEFKLLTTLLESIGRVQTRGFLLERVWDMPPDLNTRTVDTHVKRLREKMGAASAYIQTVRGVGYRFKKV